MTPLDPILFRELPVIRKIIADETWLEGERRGCPIAATDSVVRENVCRVILRVGAQLRASLTSEPAGAGVAFAASRTTVEMTPPVETHIAA